MPAPAQDVTPEPEEDAVASASPGLPGWLVGGALVLLLLIGAGIFYFGSKAAPGAPDLNYVGTPVAQDAPVPAGWETFRDTQSRAAFAVPGEWRFATDLLPDADQPKFVSDSIEQVRVWVLGDVAGPPFMLAAVTVATDSASLTGSAQAASVVDGVAASLTDPVVSAPRSFTTANGLDAGWVDFSGVQSGVPLDGVAVALVNGKNVVVITVSQFGGQVDRDAIEQLVATVRIDRG